MQSKILFITPPFTQLNTAYPASAYLKGFLEEHDIALHSCDLSIELFTAIFTGDFLRAMFQEAQILRHYDYPEVRRMQAKYIQCVDVVIPFLQKQDLATAHKILEPNFLPLGHRLSKVNTSIKWDAGEIGIIDKAKHYGTLFIEEIGDFIQANVDEFFAFTKYAEQIATSASSFNEIDEFLSFQPTLIEEKMLDILIENIKSEKPILVCFTIPFPGNLFASLTVCPIYQTVFS